MTTTLTLATAHGPLRVARCAPQFGAPPWPVLLFCIDGVGLRPALEEMAQRFADDANVVVYVPDLFFRSGDLYDLLPPGTPKVPSSVWPLLGDAAWRSTWRAKFFDVASDASTVEAAFAAVFAAADADRDVDKAAGTGVTGYCMGGGIALKVAGLFADRVKAAASFHGGFLATEAPGSPHTFAPAIKARVHVAAAAEDPSFPDAQKEKLVAAFAAARVDAVVETVKARHGWCVPDSPSFNEEEAKKSQKTLTQMLRALKR